MTGLVQGHVLNLIISNDYCLVEKCRNSSFSISIVSSLMSSSLDLNLAHLHPYSKFMIIHYLDGRILIIGNFVDVTNAIIELG